MDIRMAPIPSIYKPKEMVILIKTPQDELFIRHFIQKVLEELGTDLTDLEIEFATNMLNKATEEPKDNE